MGLDIKKTLQGWISHEDEEEVQEAYEEEVLEETPRVSKYEKANSKVVDDIAPDTKMVIFEPRKVDDAKEIATRLMQDKAAVINIHKLDDTSKQRIIDILYGVCFALNGELKQIDTNVFLCTPRSVGVQGNILDDEEI